MNKDKTFEKSISDIVGVFTDPIIVFPGGWGDTLPDWLKTTITLERLGMNMRELKGELPTGTDAEACAYLMTLSLTQPMDHDWHKIYLYIATKACENWRTKETMPEDIRVDSLNDEQMRDLDRLKAWIYEKRKTARLDHDRAERRQKKEEAAATREEAQPALFDL